MSPTPRTCPEGYHLEVSTLTPFVRPGLDILFVGLNPAGGSSRNRHYFSVNQAFWSQLHGAGLITRPVDKMGADDIVFGSTEVNAFGWNYGITDLVVEVAESDSRRVKPTRADCERLVAQVAEIRPRAVVLLHSKVRRALGRYLLMPDLAGYGYLGRLLASSPADFFAVAFPHGSSVKSSETVGYYQAIVRHLRAGSPET